MKSHGLIHEAALDALKIAAAAVLLAALLSGLPAKAGDWVGEADVTGVRVQLDNDLFAGGGKRDRDYTGGMAVMQSGRAAADGVLSLNPLLERLDGLVTPDADASVVRHARQVGLMAFTPGDILATRPLADDRPYASLLFVSNGRVRVAEDNRDAWFSSVTIGVLGLSLSERLHTSLHELVGSDRPQGYDHQISAGGEPTARYTLARQHLWIANPSGTVDVKTIVQGSVGYLTETSAAISLRAGRFGSAWWSFTPELTDYIAAPTPIEAQRSRPELFFFTGLRLKARAYNAFLQGQFRASEVTYSAAQIEPVIAEAWVGLVTQLMEQTQLSYTLNYQTAEVRRGSAARDALWGALQFSHTF